MAQRPVLVMQFVDGELAGKSLTFSVPIGVPFDVGRRYAKASFAQQYEYVLDEFPQDSGVYLARLKPIEPSAQATCDESRHVYDGFSTQCRCTLGPMRYIS